LRAHLARQLAEMDNDPGTADWRAWNLARWDALARLAAHRADLAGADTSLLAGRDDFDWIPAPDGEPLPSVPGQTVP
jgi:hypothetical protein